VAELTIRLLGGLRLEHEGAVAELGPPRAGALVAYLLVHRERAHQRASLAYLLWPDSDEAQARTNLRQTLFHLRRAFPGAERFVALDGQHLQWRSDAPCDLDLARFDDALARAAEAGTAGDVQEERAALEEAVRLHRGDLLPEMYEEWIDEPRERLREQVGRALERLVTITEGQGDHRAAVSFAERLVRHDPLVESSYRRLMLLQARGGDRAKALHVYHSCASVLRRELGIAPDVETRAIYEQVLRGEAAPEAHESPRDGQVRVHDPHSPMPAVEDPPLVGRHGEMARLRAGWREASAGRPSLVLVTGDPGIGKSRLVEEFARSLLPREARVAATRCYTAEGVLAFAPVTALLRNEALASALAGLDPVWRSEAGRLVPELVGDGAGIPEPLTEGWQRERLFEALSRAVLGAQPLVVLVDDLQWCDHDTLEWLHYLLRFDPDARLLVIATVRTHELSLNAGLQTLLPVLQRDDLVQEIELAPLSEEETLKLGRGLRELEPDVLSTLFEATEGNPLFVVEMVRGAGGDAGTPVAERPTLALPPKVRAAIASHLKQLSPRSADLMRMAAVIGREFGFELLVTVSRESEDVVVRALDELWQRRVVRESRAGQYDFSHDKLREVAYEELSLTRTRLLHRYTAEALESLHAGQRDVVSGRIAYHYEQAGYPERAVVDYRRAADAAVRLFAHEEAVAAYRRALRLVETLPASAALADWRHEIAAQVLEGLGDVHGLQGKHEDARRYFDLALARLAESDRIGRARLRRRVGLRWVAEYRYDEAHASYDAAQGVLGSGSADAGAAWWHEWIEVGLARSWLHYWRVEGRENARVLASMTSAVEQHGTALQRGTYYQSLSRMMFVRDGATVSDEALEHARVALAAIEETGVRSAVEHARFNLAMSCLWHSDLAEAEERLVRVLRSAERIGDVLLRARALTYLGFVHRMLGHEDATRAYALRSLEAAESSRMPEYIGVARGHLAWLAWKAEDLSSSVREGEAALESWRSGQPIGFQWAARLPLMATMLRQGRLPEAVALAAPMLEPLQQRLPDALRSALEDAVGAAGDAAGIEASLERAVALAQEARLL
jgi:DNA-binding SARP family transcriptional activator/tetratricopeptide (TPR) repeat protein